MYQEICATFTGDHKAVASIILGNIEAALPQCLAKGGSMMLSHGHYLRDQADYRALPTVVTPNDPASDRVARAMVEQMLAKGKVKRGEKLGLLTEVVAPDALADRLRELAAMVNRNAPLAVRGTRLAIRKGLGVPLYEAELLAEAFRERVLHTEDAKEGPRAFMEKREPQWRAE